MRKPGGKLVVLEFKGIVQRWDGTKLEVATMVLEAEMHGNAGKSRVRLFLE